MATHFTLEQAQALLPEVEQTIREAMRLRCQVQVADDEGKQITLRIAASGGAFVDREKVVEIRARRDTAITGLKVAVEKLHLLGCLVKDLDTGLVDFPTLYKGREVYLCWKLGEPIIEYWHATDAGFAGRQAINEEFVANHRGGLHH